LQRLFSVFPNGWPGRGLLLQRVVTAMFLFSFGFDRHREITLFILHMIGAGAGTLLLLGLWTPVCGALIAVVEVWIALYYAGCGTSIVLAALGATVAMIGPGAWSIDARLFGRKHFEIPQR
jgi:putative oxidoreductase